MLLWVSFKLHEFHVFGRAPTTFRCGKVPLRGSCDTWPEETVLNTHTKLKIRGRKKVAIGREGIMENIQNCNIIYSLFFYQFTSEYFHQFISLYIDKVKNTLCMLPYQLVFMISKSNVYYSQLGTLFCYGNSVNNMQLHFYTWLLENAYEASYRIVAWALTFTFVHSIHSISLCKVNLGSISETS